MLSRKRKMTDSVEPSHKKSRLIEHPSSNVSQLEQLPVEMFNYITHYLPKEDKLNLGSTNSNLRQLVFHDIKQTYQNPFHIIENLNEFTAVDLAQFGLNKDTPYFSLREHASFFKMLAKEQYQEVCLLKLGVSHAIKCYEANDFTQGYINTLASIDITYSIDQLMRQLPAQNLNEYVKINQLINRVNCGLLEIALLKQRRDIRNNHTFSLTDLPLTRLTTEGMNDYTYNLIGYINCLTITQCSLKYIASDFTSEIEINLKQLSITHCKQLEAMPGTLSELESLEDLNLSNNAIKTLPAYVLDSLYHLKCLDLSNNALTHLPNHFLRLGVIEQLNLSNNEFESVPKELNEVLSLVTINMANNQVTTLPQAFLSQSGSRLERLDLNNNPLTGNIAQFKSELAGMRPGLTIDAESSMAKKFVLN